MKLTLGSVVLIDTSVDIGGLNRPASESLDRKIEGVEQINVELHGVRIKTQKMFFIFISPLSAFMSNPSNPTRSNFAFIGGAPIGNDVLIYRKGDNVCETILSATPKAGRCPNLGDQAF
jgi:hypothetical protein